MQVHVALRMQQLLTKCNSNCIEWILYFELVQIKLCTDLNFIQFQNFNKVLCYSTTEEQATRITT